MGCAQPCDAQDPVQHVSEVCAGSHDVVEASETRTLAKVGAGRVGLALILSVTDERPYAAELEQKHAVACATELGLQVWRVVSNPTAKQMQDSIKQFAEADHSSSFMGAIILGCRSTSTAFLGSNHTEVEKTALLDDFNTCRSLLGKPKLWFIQSCQTESSSDEEGITSAQTQPEVFCVSHEAHVDDAEASQGLMMKCVEQAVKSDDFLTKPLEQIIEKATEIMSQGGRILESTDMRSLPNLIDMVDEKQDLELEAKETKEQKLDSPELVHHYKNQTVEQRKKYFLDRVARIKDQNEQSRRVARVPQRNVERHVRINKANKR